MERFKKAVEYFSAACKPRSPNLGPPSFICECWTSRTEPVRIFMQFYTIMAHFYPSKGATYTLIYANCPTSICICLKLFLLPPPVQYLVLDPIRLEDHPVTWDRCSLGRIR